MTEEQTTEQNADLAAELEGKLAQANERITLMERALGEAVDGYRAAVLAINPQVPSEMVTGGTINEINSALESAKGLVGRIRKGLAAARQVPAGAPERRGADLSGLTPHEKIQYGLGGKK